jgi:hypothetical protein
MYSKARSEVKRKRNFNHLLFPAFPGRAAQSGFLPTFFNLPLAVYQCTLTFAAGK